MFHSFASAKGHVVTSHLGSAWWIMVGQAQDGRKEVWYISFYCACVGLTTVFNPFQLNFYPRIDQIYSYSPFILAAWRLIGLMLNSNNHTNVRMGRRRNIGADNWVFPTTFLCVFMPFLTSFAPAPAPFVPLLGSLMELMCSNYPIKACWNLNAHVGSYFLKAYQIMWECRAQCQFRGPRQKCFPAAISTGAIYRREHPSVGGGRRYSPVNISDGTATYIQASE